MGPMRSNPRVAVLGAGAGGVAMGASLRRAGIDDFTIYERSDGVGGTWRANTYPGACCDAKSHLYSFSFAPWSEWSRHYAAQPEILEYLEHCATDQGLRSHLCTGTGISALRWDDDRSCWELTTEAGESHTADVVVSALGQLNRPSVPDLPGLDSFAGTAFHSARWEHDHDLHGRRVAVIGNAASGVQFIPQIAPEVEQLHVYQRSANWILPRINPPYSERTKEAFRDVPGLMAAYRAFLYASYESRYFLMRKDSSMARTVERLAVRYLEKVVDDPELRAALTPDYPAGCKRLLISSDYLPALTRENVELVTTPIERISPSGVVSTDGVEREVDTIIFGTGFDSTHFLAPLEVTGRDGRSLREVWRDGAAAYRGVSVPGFPNLYLLYGPNTNLGHNSIFFMLERQVAMVMRCLHRADALGGAIEVGGEPFERYNADLQASMHKMVWESGCRSWYKNAAGKVTNNWPHTTLRYWAETRLGGLGAYQRVGRRASTDRRPAAPTGSTGQGASGGPVRADR